MSVNPTSMLGRAAVLTAVAALALPTAAIAKPDKDKDKSQGQGHSQSHGNNGNGHGNGNANGHKKDKDKGNKPQEQGQPGNAPAACEPEKMNRHPHGGPPGLTKKADEMPECRDVDEAKPAPAPAPATAPAPAPAPAAPVTVVAQSRAALPPCESRRHFRIRLDRGGLKVRKARVLLNGRAIPVTKGGKGRRWTALIDLRRRAKGTYSVRSTVVTKSGRLKTGTRRFRTCG